MSNSSSCCSMSDLNGKSRYHVMPERFSLQAVTFFDDKQSVLGQADIRFYCLCLTLFITKDDNSEVMLVCFFLRE